MKELINFFKEIFMLEQNDKNLVGLSQFRYSKATVPAKKQQPAKKEDIKLSDLMRRSY